MIIEVSGIDGSGKTTLAQRIRRHVLESGIHAWERSLRSVTKLHLGDIAAVHGASHWSKAFDVDQVEFAHAMEMLGMCRQHFDPLDRTRHCFVTDTYVWRWLATAAMWQATNLPSLAQLFATLRAPEVSIRLEVSADLAYERILARPQGDSLLKMRDRSRLDRYAAAFDQVAGLVPYKTLVIDANRPVDEVVDEALAHVDVELARSV